MTVAVLLRISNVFCPLEVAAVVRKISSRPSCVILFSAVIITVISLQLTHSRDMAKNKHTLVAMVPIVVAMVTFLWCVPTNQRKILVCVNRLIQCVAFARLQN